MGEQPTELTTGAEGTGVTGGWPGVTGGWPGAAVGAGVVVLPEAVGDPLGEALPDVLGEGVVCGVALISASICSMRPSMLAAISAAEDWCSGLSKCAIRTRPSP